MKRRRRRSSTARGRCRASTATTRRSPATARSIAQFPALALGGRGAVPVRAGSTTTAGASARACPALQATLDRFGSSALRRRRRLVPGVRALPARRHRRGGRRPRSLRAPARDRASPPTRSPARVAYWRARIEREGRARRTRPSAGYRELAQRAPLSYYGLLARARLKQAGQTVPSSCPTKKVAVETPRKPTARAVGGARDRADRGGDDRRGRRGARANEKEILKRLGGDKALPLAARSLPARRRLPPRLPAGRVARRRRARPPIRAPTRARARCGRRHTRGRTRRWSRSTGRRPATRSCSCTRSCARNRGSIPHDVSYADARGLLQMIPPTSAQVAAAMGEPFFPDQLYDPEMNIRLGALLHRLALQQVRPRAAADRRRLQRRARA